MKKLIKNIKIFISGTKKMFKEFFHKKTCKKQIANVLSFIRLVLIIPVSILICFYLSNNNKTLLIITGVLTLIGGITDFFDGKCARKFNASSEYGKKLDQIADKTFASILSLLLITIHPYFIIVFLMELLIIITNALYNLKYPDINNDSNFIGKLKQWPLFALLFVGFLSKLDNTFLNITVILFYLTVVMQILTILSYIGKHTKEIKKYIAKKIKGTK